MTGREGSTSREADDSTSREADDFRRSSDVAPKMSVVNADGAPVAAERRIVSLLPSATEILNAVGVRDRIVGCTHECDYPLGISALPHVTRSLLPPNLTSEQIDQAVSLAMKSDEHTIYALEHDLVRSLAPAIIVTQKLCDVCAVPMRNAEKLACTLPQNCKVISADPTTLEELFDSVKIVGDAVGAGPGTDACIADLRLRLARIENLTRSVAPKMRVAVLEWPDPPYAPGYV